MFPIHKTYRVQSRLLLFHTVILFSKTEKLGSHCPQYYLFVQSSSYVNQYCISAPSFLSGYDITHEAALPQGQFSHLVLMPKACTRPSPWLHREDSSLPLLELQHPTWIPLPALDALFTVRLCHTVGQPSHARCLLSSPCSFFVSVPGPHLGRPRLPHSAWCWMLVLGRPSMSIPSSPYIGIPSAQKSCSPCSPCSGSITVPGHLMQMSY